MAKKTKVSDILAKAKKDRPPRDSFEKIVTGYAFKLIGRGTMPEGKRFWCAFCGGRGKYYIEILRDDKTKFKVGANCVSKVGLIPPPKEKEGKTVVPVQAVKPNNSVVEAPKTKTEKVLDDEIQALLDSL